MTDLYKVDMKFGTVESQTKMVPEGDGLTLYSRRLERDLDGVITHTSEWEKLSHMRFVGSYPKRITCRWTGVEAMVDGRPAEIAFLVLVPFLAFTVLSPFLVLALALWEAFA